ncbi:MAG: sialidase family protein [Chloroflexota bacterium]
MTTLRAPALLLAGLLLLTAAPAVAQSPAPSPGSGSATTSGRAAPQARWKQGKAALVRRAGILGHAVTLGDEVIAIATGTDKHDQAVARTLATKDGNRWRKRGQIKLVGSINDLIADGDTLYAVGWNEGAAVWRSTDGGKTWTRPKDAAPFAGSADGGGGDDQAASAVAIAKGPAGLLIVGSVTDPVTLARRGAAWRSADGTTWERLPGAAALPPFRGLAADGTTYVAVSATSGLAMSPFGADASRLRWSTDGATWTAATVDLAGGESVDGVTALEGGGFLAWGHPYGPEVAAGSPAITWTSTDGRNFTRGSTDAALAGADLAVIRSLEGGALVMGVGGAPEGAYAFPSLGDAWRRDTIRPGGQLCVNDVASVKAILIAVGGACGAKKATGRAWTTPLEP